MVTATFTDRSTTGYRPGSEAWMRYVTASKIAAIMGHSTYDSWFSLWHRMNGSMEVDPGDVTTQRGTYLEPAILAWFNDQHPEWTLKRTGFWVHETIPWAGASPDGIVVTDDGTAAVVEAKSSGLSYEWGEPGTDQIPLGHYDQVQWQMFVTGLRRAYVPMIGAGLAFAEYVVEYNADHVGAMIARATEFMASLTSGMKPSIDPLDGHLMTYRAIQELNPGIEDYDQPIGDELAQEFLTANEVVKNATTRLQAAKNRVAEQAGQAHHVVWINGDTTHTLFTRQSKGGGTPYLVTARGLPPVQQEN